MDDLVLQGMETEDVGRMLRWLRSVTDSRTAPLGVRETAARAEMYLNRLTDPAFDSDRCVRCLMDVRYCPPDFACQHGYDRTGDQVRANVTPVRGTVVWPEDVMTTERICGQYLGSTGRRPRCRLPHGHDGSHRDSEGFSWPQDAC